MQILDCEQGDDAWRAARAGIATASAMSQLLARGQGKTRASYQFKLIGEVFTGEPAEGFTNSHTERGHLLEGEAREIYAAIAEGEVMQCGFIRNHDDIGGVGYSPDALVGSEGLAEIKTKLPHLQAELLLADRVPPEHMAQIQCGLWVSERRWLDFVSYWPGMPLFVKRVYRDEAYIQNMRSEVIAFYAEMQSKIERIRGL
jgi:hypothetical protein